MSKLNIPFKTIYTFFLLSFSISNFTLAQTPPDSLSGEELKTWFKANWYDGLHTTLGYDGVNGARSYMYNIIDNHGDTVTCVYSGHKEYRIYDLSRSDGTSGMTPINCEHSIPQSYFNYFEPMKSDIHHLYPSYQNWNSTRSNHPFGDINNEETEKWMYLTADQTAIPTANIDLWSEFKSGIFEPREDHKGNLARAIFYFYTMYPTEAGNLSNLGDSITFFNWHLNDPADALEYQRDDDIYNYQGNANPYLTNPNWISRVFNLGNLPPPELALTASYSDLTISWGDMPTEIGYKIYRSSDNNSFSQIGGTLASNTVKHVDNAVSFGNTYYYYLTGEYSGGSSVSSDTISGTLLAPSPPSAITDLASTSTTTSIDLSWSDVALEVSYQVYRSIDNINFNLIGSTLAANTTSFSDNSALSSITYYYYIIASNTYGNSSNSNSVNGQILDRANLASNLIISEYIEGSSYNKAIEIANFTGASVDLSNYQLGKQTNGAGSWSLLSLSGSLADASTYVVANSNASSTLLTKADIASSSTVVNFNGNDPVALFENSNLVDIVGEEDGGTGNFAKDMTLVRNADVTGPNNSYTTSEWTTNAQDNFSNTGMHTMNLGVNLPVTLVSFDGQIYPKFNRLEWLTLSEINSHFFEIQISENGMDFKTIGKIITGDNSNDLKRYEFVDNYPEISSYYRLKQVDKDGDIEYSEILHLSRIIETIHLALAPNPADKFIYLTLELPDDGFIEIDIYNITGQRILRNKIEFSQGNHIYEIPINDFENGVYFLEMKNRNELIRRKFVKIR